jgi:hypothetical protein
VLARRYRDDVGPWRVHAGLDRAADAERPLARRNPLDRSLMDGQVTVMDLTMRAAAAAPRPRSTG